MVQHTHAHDAPTPAGLRFGDFHLAGPHGPLRQAGEVVDLPRTPLALLWTLATRAGEVVTKAQLLALVWPRVVVTEGVITTSLRALRRALGDDARRPRFVATAHRIGYRFIAEVTAAVEQAAAAQATASPPPEAETMPMPWVGRTTELAHLRAAHGRALAGHRQIVFVTGDAGIGKSRLVETFVSSLGREALADADAHAGGMRLGHGQCIEHYGEGEPYLPVLEAVTRACREPGGHELLDALRRHAPTWLAQLPGLLPAEPTATAPAAPLAGSARRMMREMAEAIDAAAARRPLVLVFEDMHWSDPSTVDWLAMLARRRERARLLIVATCRPIELIVHDHPLKRVKRELLAHSAATEVMLGCLPPDDVQAYVAQRLRARPTALDAAAAVNRRSAGHPLFMQHMTDDLMRSPDGFDDASMPHGVAELIDAQLSRLAPDALAVLEAASVAGAEFAAASVAAALGRSTRHVERVLDMLAQRQQCIEARGLDERNDGTVCGRYGFRHDLYRDALYRRLGAAARARMHACIGEQLAAAGHARGVDIAAELALHFENARQVPLAVRYRRAAGDKALHRFAYGEALLHAARGLALLGARPERPDEASELGLLLTQGAALLAVRGYGAPEVEVTYQRALAHAIGLDDRDAIGPALSGLHNLYLTRGAFGRVGRIADQVLGIVERRPEPVLSMLANTMRGTALFFTGDAAASLRRFGESLSLYDVNAHGTLAASYGEDPAMACHHIAMLACWITGAPRRSMDHLADGYALAEALGQPFGEAQMLWMEAVLRLDAGDFDRVEASTERLTRICAEHEFPLWMAGGQILQGAAWAARGRIDEGRARTRQGLDAWRAAGTLLTLPHALAVAAGIEVLAGRAEDALRLLGEALDVSRSTGEAWYEPELHRLRGDLAWADPEGAPADAARAQACFEQALDLARRQGARLFEVRASARLAALWLSQGRVAQALGLLRQAVDAGRDMTDGRDARAVIELLADASSARRSGPRNEAWSARRGAG